MRLSWVGDILLEAPAMAIFTIFDLRGKPAVILDIYENQTRTCADGR